MRFFSPFILCDEEKSDTSSLGSVIDKAIADVPNTDSKTPDNKSGETTDETNPEKDKEVSETPKTEPVVDESKQAQELWESLKNPDTRDTVIEWLAKQQGYTKVVPETKAETAQAVDDIQEALREALGPDLESIADKLAPAIRKILAKQIPEATKDLREAEAARESARHEASAASEAEKISNEYFLGKGIPKDVEEAMVALMDEMPPSAKTSAEKYVRRIFNSVAGERGIAKKSQTQQQVRNKNESDVVSKLASVSKGHLPDTSSDDKAKSLSQVIDDAMKIASEG